MPYALTPQLDCLGAEGRGSCPSLTIDIKHAGHIVCHDFDRSVSDERKELMTGISYHSELQEVDMEDGLLR